MPDFQVMKSYLSNFYRKISGIFSSQSENSKNCQAFKKFNKIPNYYLYICFIWEWWKSFLNSRIHISNKNNKIKEHKMKLVVIGPGQ